MSKMIAGIAMMTLVGTGFAQPLSVTVTVKEPGGVTRKSAPVSGGIPLPWGV